MADIAYKRDLDARLAKEMGWSVEKAKENSDYLIKRMKQLMSDPTIDIIFMNSLGSLYSKTYMIDYKIRNAIHFGAKINPKWSIRRKRVDDILQEVDWIKFKQFNVKIRLFNKYYTRGRKFKQLEEYQNEQNK